MLKIVISCIFPKYACRSIIYEVLTPILLHDYLYKFIHQVIETFAYDSYLLDLDTLITKLPFPCMIAY